MAVQKELRLGFIGMGPRGAGLAKTCKTVSGLKVTALCDRYRDLVERAAQNLDDPDVKLYTEHAKMLKEAPIDAVFVVVEPENCPQLVLDSLEAGKHVLSEVPMSFTMEDLWRIVVTVERTGLKYMMGEQVRYMPFMQKWKELLEDGTLGKIVYAEGQYLHGVTGDRFYMDPVTGRRLTLEEAKLHHNPKQSRFWNLTHPILYLPHELSPLLRVLNDRVVSVVCMGTRPQSYVHDFLPRPDFETALMHTANDTLLRLSCCFTIFQIEKKMTGRHWYNLIGTKGSVETHRSNHDQMKLLIAGDGNEYPEEVWWDWDSLKVPPEAL
ncbi:MAG: Gfo/Idh/MocA family oxidoreductase, partial [Armatimonadetes bacterium]|nr:Gfo/Idh/MocA family oxidoreductase [Armatimonadota bacterium]